MSKRHKGKSSRQDAGEETVKIQLRKERERANNLARENSRLRSELRKRHDVATDYRELLQERTEATPPETKVKQTCAECKEGQIDEITIGDFVFIRCDNCTFQRRKK